MTNIEYADHVPMNVLLPDSAAEPVVIFERNMLESTILPIRRLLRLLGYDPASADDSETVQDAPRSKQPLGKTYHGITLSEIVASGLIQLGSQLTSTNSASPAQATVVAEGVKFGGTTYGTPSGAGAAARGGAVNGWDFWAVSTLNGPVPLATYRE